MLAHVSSSRNPNPRDPLPDDPLRLAAEVDALADPDTWSDLMHALTAIRWDLERWPAATETVPDLEALADRLASADARMRGQARALRVMRADLRRCLHRRGARRPRWAEEARVYLPRPGGRA